MARGRFAVPVYGVIGAVLLLAVLELVGRTGLAGPAWPPLGDVVAFLLNPANHRVLGGALGATVTAALTGGAIGVVAGVVFAVVAVLLPRTAPGLDRFAALIDAMPAIALAPFLSVILGRDATPAVIPALAVTFIVYLSTSSGLAATSMSHHDLFTVVGASRVRRLGRLQLPAALPSLFDGLALAAPAMILGATIGEWFGASRGLGVLLLSSMQNFQIPLLWAAATLAVLCSLVAFLLMTAAQRAVSRRFS